MRLVINAVGSIRCVYSETIDLLSLGQPTIQRASQVEPTPEGQWQADLSPVGGPALGPFPLRSDALAAESQWLDENWLTVR